MTTIDLPSPKPPTADRSTANRWYRFYAMFSEEFARRAIIHADLPSQAIILDPWLGAGTTTAIAAEAGFQAIGVDINPAMIVIARGRTAPRSIASKVLSDTSRIASSLQSTPSPDDPLLDWFQPATAATIRTWAEAISRTSNDADVSEAGAFMLTALFEVARTLASPCRAKNPTWYKVPQPKERIRVSRSNLQRQLFNVATKRLALLPDNPPTNQPQLELGTSHNLPLADRSVDFVLTSPPYCTRIDYAIATRLELAVLGRTPASIDSLRNSTMGSSTIRGHCPEPSPDWGKTCLHFLDIVTRHPSKASYQYYRKTYSQYFDDLFRSISELSRCARRAASIVIVVQDSYYKGVRVDLASICEEMGTCVGLSKLAQQDHPLQRSIRSLNTRSRQYGDGRPTETVLWLRKHS